MNEPKTSKGVLRDVYLKIGRRYFEWDDKLHIQQLENGFVFFQKFYPDIESLMPALEESLKKHFNNEI